MQLTPRPHHRESQKRQDIIKTPNDVYTEYIYGKSKFTNQKPTMHSGTNQHPLLLSPLTRTHKKKRDDRQDSTTDENKNTTKNSTLHTPNISLFLSFFSVLFSLRITDKKHERLVWPNVLNSTAQFWGYCLKERTNNLYLADLYISASRRSGNCVVYLHPRRFPCYFWGGSVSYPYAPATVLYY